VTTFDLKRILSRQATKGLLICLSVVPIFALAQTEESMRLTPLSAEPQAPGAPKETTQSLERLERESTDKNKGRQSLRSEEDSEWIRNTKTHPPQRLQFLLKAPPREIDIIKMGGGGGAADGGGGNTSASTGELLDRQIFAGTQKLKTEDLQKLFYANLENRLQAIEQELPGFTDWILFGFRKTWYLDQKNFDAKKCLRQLCQTSTSIFINQEVFQKSSDSDKSYWILRALLAAQVQRSVLPVENPYRLAETIVVQILKKKISGKTIYQILSVNHVLDSAEVAENRRAQWVKVIDEQLKKVDVSWAKILKTCAGGPFDLSKSIRAAKNEYRKIAQLCLQIANPAEDGNACDRKSIHETMDLLNSSPCSDSSALDD